MTRSVRPIASGSASLLDRYPNAAVGPQGLITDPRDMEPYVVDWRGYLSRRDTGHRAPASTGEVAAVVKLCAETRTGIVPQGGNTGMCGGATPSRRGHRDRARLGPHEPHPRSGCAQQHDHRRSGLRTREYAAARRRRRPASSR